VYASDRLPSSRTTMSVSFPDLEQVYLRSAKNATVLPYLLAYQPNILAKEKGSWRKRDETNGK